MLSLVSEGWVLSRQTHMLVSCLGRVDRFLQSRQTRGYYRRGILSDDELPPVGGQLPRRIDLTFLFRW